MAAAATVGGVGAVSFPDVGAFDAERAEPRALPITFWPAVLLVLNLLDGLFTLTWVELNIGWEANPLMRAALEGSPVIFMAAKMVLVQVGTWLLATHSDSKAARAALAGGCILYSGIAMWHLSFLARVII